MIGMRRKQKPSIKCVLLLLGIMLGMECSGSWGRIIDGQVRKVELAVMGYIALEGKFPASLDELALPIGKTTPLLKKEDLIDQWGEPFGYEHSDDLEGGFIVWSSGPDRKAGTADDIVRGFSSLVEEWKVRHGLPVVTNTVQQTMTAEEKARLEEEAAREMEWLIQQVEESRRADKARTRQVVTVAALILGFYIALPRLLKKFKRGVVRHILIAVGILLGVLVILWCALLAQVTWKSHIKFKQRYMTPRAPSAHIQTGEIEKTLWTR